MHEVLPADGAVAAAWARDVPGAAGAEAGAGAAATRILPGGTNTHAPAVDSTAPLRAPADTSYHQVARAAQGMPEVVAQNPRLAAVMLHQQEDRINELQEQVGEARGCAMLGPGLLECAGVWCCGAVLSCALVLMYML